MTENKNVLIENVKNEVVMILATIDSERFLEYFMSGPHNENTKNWARELVSRSKSASKQSSVQRNAETNNIIQTLRRELENDRKTINST